MANIKFTGVHKSFGSNKIIADFNLNGKEDEFLVLVGPSGCGKSTLLRMIAGLEKIDDGEIFINDQKINELHPSKRQTAMVFQSYALYPHLTVLQNLMVPLKLRRMSTMERFPVLNWFLPNRKKKIDELKELVLKASETLQIKHLLGRKPGQLSGGQQQRVAVGRAMVRDPVAFLMDEPLSNLDAALRVHMRAEISELHRKLNTTFVYVTHDQAEALTMSDRMAVMMDGEILQLDTPSEIYERPANLKVAEFIGSPKINILSAESDINGDINCMGLLMPFSVKDKKNEKILLGIRPEHTNLLKDDNKKCFLGEVNHKENLGSDIYLHVTLKDSQQKMIVRSNPDISLNTKIGETIIIGFDHNKVMIFSEIGQNIQKKS